MYSIMSVIFRISFIILLSSYCYKIVDGHVRFQRESSHLDINEVFKSIKEDNHKTPTVNSEDVKSGKGKGGAGCSGCPGHSLCVAPVQCPAHVRMGHGGTRCHLPHGREGICCVTGQNHTTVEDLKARHNLAHDLKSLKAAAIKAKLRLARLLEKESDIMSSTNYKTVVPRGSPTFGHFQSQRTINPLEVSKIGAGAFLNLFATQALKERESISNEDIALGLSRMKLEEPPCPPQPSCQKQILSKYRTLDGTCNNLIHTSWGAARTATERLLPPYYDDGIWSPRGTSSPLPPARAASAKLVLDKDRPHQRANLLTMQFGQFIAHDVSSSVTLTFGNGSAISCCSEDGTTVLPKELQHFACFPIEMDSKDDFYGKFGQRCMNFVRTQLAPNHDCSLGYAKQMNGVTHFLDLSLIYGSHPNTLSPLRQWSGGKLKMFTDFGRDLLPLSNDKNDCITMEQGSACFKSGDGRANQMISLVAVHLIFTREHNRIAEILCKLNPHWSDQLAFLEARKIVIAEYQHIVYSEYLPLVIGERAMEEFELAPRHGFSLDYDMKTNPSLTNEFVTAAFRFGHSTVNGKLHIPQGHEIDEVISIPEVMFHPARMRMNEFYDRMLISMTTQPMQETDPSLTAQLTQYLFRGGNPHGLDLASLNIQRGRDHGIRSYNDYRELVGLPRIKSFHDFGHSIAEQMSSVYGSPDDIDLWLGGLLEAPEEDALVGYTFREIIADQFSRLRKGDRYFYEHGPLSNPGHFTFAQLSEIKKTSMSRLICDNSDHIELHHQSSNAFMRPVLHGNEPIDCQSHQIPFVDLSHWKEF